MHKIKSYTGWAIALLLVLFAAACLLGPPSALADGDWARVDDASLAEFILKDVFAVSPSDVWAGGYNRGGVEQLVHYDGDTEETSKIVTVGLSQIYCLWAAGPDDIYVVGIKGQYGYIFNYDGEVWPESHEYKSARNKFLRGVWGSGPGDVYAVGNSGTIIHNDGKSWSAMVSGSAETLYGVWGSGPGNVYAVGSSGTIVHYDGTEWSTMESGSASDLSGVWGSGPGDVYAVGYSGTIVHYDGTIWSAMESGTTSDLNGIWGSGPDDVYAVGNDGTILRYNGRTWSAMDSGTTGALQAVSGSGSEVYAVGYKFEGEVGYGVIYHHTVTADVPVTGVSLAPETLSLAAGETCALTATVAPSEASDRSVQWSSGDESVATVDDGGTVTAVSPGDTAITVTTADGGFTASCALTVNTASPIEAPVITPDGGVYEASQEVTVSIQADLTENQAIYYNTDGSELSVASSVYYMAPFALQIEQGATTVQAAVYESGSGRWGQVGTAVFTVGTTRPAVTGVSPAWGPFAGGTIVTLNGTNLSTVEAVYFGGNAGTGLNIKSDTLLNVASPAGSGTVDVIASGPNGASAASSAARFAYRVSAGEITGEPVIATLPGSDAVLPFELYPGQRGFSHEPCFITVPAGTDQITIKKDPAKAITSLTVSDADYNAFPTDEGQPYSVTVPATATRQAPYWICYEYDHYIKNIYFYCVEENAPNPFVTPYSALTVPEGEAISLNVTGAGAPPQAVEWYYGYNKDSTYEKIYQKLEGKTSAALDIAISQDALNLGYLNETYGQYYLCFYAKIGGYISNQVGVSVKEMSITGAKSLEASNWGSYAGARQWLNVGAAFGNLVAADTPVKFYLTAVENGTPDTAVAGTLLETTVAAVPAHAAYGEKDTGFIVGPLPSGEYWLALQLGTGETASCRYRPFTVYPGVKEYVKAALDKMISYYQNIFLIQNGKYVGLSERVDQFGTDWMVWMLCNYGHTVSDSLMAGADGKTYLDSLDETLSYREQVGMKNSAKDCFRSVCALCAAGADPRDFNGRNLVTELLSRAYNDDDTLKLDENGALEFESDVLSVSYTLLAAEISCATEAEGYTDALKKAGIKRILPTVEHAVNAQNAAGIAGVDWLAMQSYPLYFLQDDDEYGARIRAAIGKMAALVSAYQSTNGGLGSSWPGGSSEFDEPLAADGYGIAPNSMAVMLNALVLFGTTAEELEDEVWQEDYGTLITALLGLQTENGAIRYYSNSENSMATYQTLGALVELYTGKSCFVNAWETYLSHYVPAVRVAGRAADPSVTMAAGNTAVAAGDHSWTIKLVTGTVKNDFTGDDLVITGLPPGLTASAAKGAENTILLTVSGTAAQPINSLTAISVVIKGEAVTEPETADSSSIKVYLSPAALSAGQVTVTDGHKDITLNGSTPAATVTVPANVSGARINLAPLLTVDAQAKNATLPADLDIEADSAVGRIKVKMPAGLVISAPASSNWAGTINVPAVQPDSNVTVTPDMGKTATVNSVIEVGAGDIPLTFDQAVRLLIPGQAGKDAGFYRNGAFTKIPTVLSADSQEAANALPEGGEGKIDVDGDLVIWTKHFTRFVTYTQTASSNEPGNGSETDNRKSAYIRVEGYEDTVVPRTAVTTDNFDLTSYLGAASGSSGTASSGWGPDKLKRPTVAHALITALEEAGINCTNHTNGLDLQDYGWSLYVAMINGEREFDHRSTSGWMYRVNGSMPGWGCQAYNLKDGDDIVWYFGAYGFDTWYAEMSASKISLKTGEETTLTLTGIKTDLSGSSGTGPSNTTKLSGAEIYVNGQPFQPGGAAIVTDENGQAKISFNNAGTYSISAERYSGEGYRNIVRPLPVLITVSGASIGESVPVPENPADAAALLGDTLNSPNPTAEQVAATLQAATASLAGALEKAKTADEAQQLLNHAAAVTGLLGKAGLNINGSQSAASFADSCVEIAGLLAALAPRISPADGQNTLAQAAVQTINATAQVMSGITDKNQLAQIANRLLDSGAAILGSLTGELNSELQQSLVNMVLQVLPGLVRETLPQDSLKSDGATLQAVISAAQTGNLAGQAVQTVAGFQQKLERMGIEQNRNLPRDIIFNIPSQGEKNVEISLPSGTLDSLAASGAGQMGVRTAAASFRFGPDSFGASARSQGVTLSAERLDENQISGGGLVPPGSIVMALQARVGGQNIDGFNSPVEVSIPYEGTPANPASVTVFLLKEDSSVEAVGGYYDPASKTVKFLAEHFSRYFAQEAVKSFEDLGSVPWAQEVIAVLAGKGIISGKGAGLFDPNAALSRAEFAALITRMLKYTATSGAALSFADVAPESWYYGAVAAAYQNGLISGRSPSQFDPEGNISREEMSAIIAKVLQSRGYRAASGTELNSFADRGRIASWAEQPAAMVIREGIITGMGDSRFAPAENATRAQAAVMLYRLYQAVMK